MESRASVGARRAPSQQRSRTIVASIVEAGRRLLAEEGEAALTTNRIAERAGVSIGSLYRYFENKQAIVAAICDDQTGRELPELRAALQSPLEERPLREWLIEVVDFQLERHRRLLELGREVYRDHHHDYSLAQRMGAQEVERRIRDVLERHRGALRVDDLEQATFVVMHGVSAIVRRALDQQPAKLAEPAFRAALLDLLLRYLLHDA